MQRPTDSNVLKSIRENNMIFVSAQPDTTYFHWQVEIYLYQFSKHGISDRCYALFGYKGSSPSTYVTTLAKKYPNIKFYKDERKQNNYSPTIRPHILAKFFREFPSFGKNIFYHDSDIFLTKLPRFDLMLLPNDNTSYVSNTISYIGYEYIKECSNRYCSKHPSLPQLDIFIGMCNIIGIDQILVTKNQNNSGGAQYLLKNIDASFWEDCETKCDELYSYLSEYEKIYPITHHIQKWTTDMWVVLWLYWKRGGNTLIHKELDFSWATSTVKEYNNLNIFHLAGITDNNSSDKFYKGKFTKVTIFDAYINNPNIFNNINKNNATYLYTEVIKEYVSSFSIEKELIVKFKINTREKYNGVYYQDDNVQCCNKSVWRSENNMYIIFWTGKHWILTSSIYESYIGPNCGGLLSNSSNKPYYCHWNRNDITISLL
jgi:hypothetical protein